MNRFKKYAPNVFIAECEEEYNTGDIIEVAAKYNDVECEVYNLIANKNGFYYYSVVRTDAESYATRKAKKYEAAANRAENKSSEWQNKASEGKDFLVLAEPIKIGHHSEGRHRALIERNDKRMRNCISESDKAEEYQRKAEYWTKKEKEINLSMPESLEFFTFKLDEAVVYHKGLKDGSIAKTHSYSVPYASKAVKDLTKKVELSKRLWA